VRSGSIVLTVSGPIERVDASRPNLLLRSPTRLVVDMTQVTFLDPSGLDVLAEAASRLANQPWPLAIVIGERHPQVRRAIDDAHLPAFRS
jgi:anti-anti-sigma regulatory factor